MAVPFLLNGSWDSGIGSETRLNRMEGIDAEGRGTNLVGITEYVYLGFFPKRISKVEKQLKKKKLR